MKDNWAMEAERPVFFLIKDSLNIFQNNDLTSFGNRERRLVVIDRNICQYYLNPLIQYFKERDIKIRVVEIDATENDKNLETLLLVLREMESFGLLRRDEPVIAIGGGVLLDIVGMAASLYRRGVPYIRVPTTLVGLVDASVGIKTGINFDNRRNRLGSYYPPLVSYLDRMFLKTLPELELRSGMGEILKMAVIRDYDLFLLLERHGAELIRSKFATLGGSSETADLVIWKAISGMCEELKPNLWEENLERIVDFGHSFSPVIEMRSLQSEHPLTHGQAVTLDIIFSSILSCMRGRIYQFDLKRLVKVVRSLGLPSEHPYFYNPLYLLEALTDTMKHRNGNQNIPIPITIRMSPFGNSSFLNDVTFQELKDATKFMAELNT